MAPMHAKFVGPLGRHGCHLQTIEPCLHIVLCVYNVQENREARCMWNAVCNLFLECKKHETSWHSSSTCEVYGEHAMNDSMVRRWMRHFNEGCKNVHDDPWSSQPSVVNEDLVRAVEETHENRWFTILSLSLHFPQISRSLLHEICMVNFVWKYTLNINTSYVW
jgi:hypothetical protein